MIELTEKEERFFRMLGLARRAGKLALGTPLSLQALHKRRARLLIVCDEASASTKKKMHTQASFYHVPLVLVKIPTEHFSHLLGKQAPVVSVAVTDDNFAAELLKSSGKEDSEQSEYGVYLWQ